jgi:hypothetical protein
VAQILYKPGADMPLDYYVTDMEADKCEREFEEFLDSTHVCYFKHGGLLHEYSEFTQYTIFFHPDSSGDHNRLKIFFRPQKNFHKETPEAVGYMELRKNQFNNISKPDIGSSLICCYSLEENDFALKPAASVRGYLTSIERHMPKGGIEEKQKRNKYLIRLTPKITKKIREQELRGESGGYKGNYPKRNPDGTLSLLVANTGSDGITHKDYYLVTRDEFAAYLKQHNNYPEGWKLKFKLIRNLLTKEF